jgi:hypothetical protein
MRLRGPVLGWSGATELSETRRDRRSFAFRRRNQRLVTDRSDRCPYPVVPDSPVTGPGRVPHHLRPWRPRRLRWLRRGPWRGRSPGPPPGRGGRTSRVLPVVALMPVPVRDVAPARVPRVARAPVAGGCGGRGRLCDGAGGQIERGKRQRAAHHRACSPPHRPFHRRHALRISLNRYPGKC